MIKALVALFPLIAAAQGAGRLTFEVASAKRVAPDAPGAPLEVTAGGALMGKTTLGFLIQAAYAIKPYQLVNAPGWLHSEEYAIAAKPPAGYKPKQPGRG